MATKNDSPYPFASKNGGYYTQEGKYLKEKPSKFSLVKEVEQDGRDLLPPEFRNLSLKEKKALAFAWGSGEEIQSLNRVDGSWNTVLDPSWFPSTRYCVKPDPITTFETFTVTSSTGEVWAKTVIPMIDGVVQDFTVCVKGKKL